MPIIHAFNHHGKNAIGIRKLFFYIKLFFFELCERENLFSS